MAKPRRKSPGRPSSPSKVSRHTRPDGLSVEEWQRELRRQFGAAQPFDLKNLGGKRVFSDYLVTNPSSRKTYRVALRGEEPGVSHRSCPDYATNLLGTCKHVEFVLASLRKRRGAARTLRAGYRPAYSSVSLVYGARRRVRLRLADGAPAALRRRAARVFDAEGWLPEERFGRFRAFLDEAQRIKNWSTRVARSVKQIASPLALVLTGTPLENRLEELLSVVQFVDQHRLGPTWRVLHDHQRFEEGTTRVVGYRDLDRLGATLAPILFRRRKDGVAALLADLLAERIEAAGFGHVFFHGGVPSGERGALVRRFRDDTACRVFLSTDAGGTGLNLQAASVVVNVDQPWNPAVLEQRIGRVHRLGQSRPVQVFDFVAEDSIEQGMLGLLGFKRALFTGLLDGGAPEVLLHGTRLSRFMETVGTVAETIPEPPRAEAASAAPAGEAPRPASAPDAAVALPAAPLEGSPSSSGPPAGAALAGLLRAGASLLGQLAAAADEAASGGAGGPGVRFERDEATGKTVLRVEVPDPEALLGALRALLKAPGGGSGSR